MSGAMTDDKPGKAMKAELLRAGILEMLCFVAGLLAHFKLAHGVQLKTLIMCQTNPVGERNQHGLLPGQFVRTRLLGVERVGAVTVPQDAVINTPGGAMVMLVNKDNVVEPRPVELGQMLGGDYVIENGLREGDRVIVAGQFRVRGKMEVRVASDSAASTPSVKPSPAGEAPAAAPKN